MSTHPPIFCKTNAQKFLYVAILGVHPSAGFASRNKISVNPRLNHRKWLTQCKNLYYYYEKKEKLNWLFVFHPRMEQEVF